MNEGPFRMPNSADKGANRPEPPADRRSEEPSPPASREESKPVVHHRSTSSRRLAKEEKSKKPLYMLIGAVVAGVVVISLLAWAFLPKGTVHPPVDSSKYQAISFNDGQLYFGKLSFVNDEYMQLKDIYYLQPQSEGSGTTDNLQKATASQNFKLVKFTDVIYGPEDEMMIPKSQVLFYEDIKSDGKVAQLIAQYKKSH